MVYKERHSQMDPSITIKAAAEILAGMVSMYNPEDKRRMKIATVNTQNQDGYTLLDNFVTSGESFDEIGTVRVPTEEELVALAAIATAEMRKKRTLALTRREDENEEGKEKADGATNNEKADGDTNKRRRITRYAQNTLQAITNNPVRTVTAGALMVGGALGMQAFSVLSPVPL